VNDETQFGGRRSVRYPDGKMLVVWGHDECIVKQYTLSKKSWIGTNGETAIVPIDEGCGIMISAFQCRKFGFGLVTYHGQLGVFSVHTTLAGRTEPCAFSHHILHYDVVVSYNIKVNHARCTDDN
jgi:uncharacterized protein (DUF608 family)